MDPAKAPDGLLVRSRLTCAILHGAYNFTDAFHVICVSSKPELRVHISILWAPLWLAQFFQVGTTMEFVSVGRGRGQLRGMWRRVALAETRRHVVAATEESTKRTRATQNTQWAVGLWREKASASQGRAN